MLIILESSNKEQKRIKTIFLGDYVAVVLDPACSGWVLNGLTVLFFRLSSSRSSGEMTFSLFSALFTGAEAEGAFPF
jgi:hypothetical protein